MKYEIKENILNYLKNGGSEQAKQGLIDYLEKNEMGYADLDCMSLCTDDEGCANLSIEQLREVADKLQDRLMEDFNSQLGEVLKELGY